MGSYLMFNKTSAPKLTAVFLLFFFLFIRLITCKFYNASSLTILFSIMTFIYLINHYQQQTLNLYMTKLIDTLKRRVNREEKTNKIYAHTDI